MQKLFRIDRDEIRPLNLNGMNIEADKYQHHIVWVMLLSESICEKCKIFVHIPYL